MSALTPRALRTRWSVQRLVRFAGGHQAEAWSAEAVTGRAVEAMGLRFPAPLLLAAGFDRRGELLAHAGALGLGGVETGSHRCVPGMPPLLTIAAWRRRQRSHPAQFASQSIHGLSLVVPSAEIGSTPALSPSASAQRRRAELLCRALVAWHSGADYVVLNPGRSGATAAECAELLAALAELRDRLPRARRLALVVKLPARWIEAWSADRGLEAWGRRLVAAGADGLLVSAEGAAQHACARLAALAAALEPRVCLISVGGIDSVRTAEARLAAGARLVQVHRAALGAVARVLPLLAGLGARAPQGRGAVRPPA